MKKFKWELILSAIIMVLLSITILVSNGVAETTHWNWPGGEWDSFTLVYTAEDGADEPKQLLFTKDKVSAEEDKMRYPGPPDMLPGVTYSVFLYATLNGQDGYHSVPFIYTKKLDTPLGLVFIDGTLNWLPAKGEYDGYIISYTIAEKTTEIEVDKDAVQEVIPLPCGGSYLISIVTYLGNIKSDSSVVISGSVPPCAPTGVYMTFP